MPSCGFSAPTSTRSPAPSASCRCSKVSRRFSRFRLRPATPAQDCHAADAQQACQPEQQSARRQGGSGGGDDGRTCAGAAGYAAGLPGRAGGIEAAGVVDATAGEAVDRIVQPALFGAGARLAGSSVADGEAVVRRRRVCVAVWVLVAVEVAVLVDVAVGVAVVTRSTSPWLLRSPSAWASVCASPSRWRYRSRSPSPSRGVGGDPADVAVGDSLDVAVGVPVAVSVAVGAGVSVGVS